MAEEVGKLTIALSFDDKSLSKSQKSVETGAQNMGSAFSVALGTVAASAATKLASIMVDLAKQTVQVGINFQSAMSKVAAISGATGSDLAALTAKAKEMGASTKFSASEAADALSYMAMAGWKTNDMLDGLSGIMNLAAASGSDLAEASDIVTDALTAFGQSAAEAGRLADIMAAASANSNTNVTLLGETFKYVAPVAGALGYSMEDTATAIGLMANAGIKGSQAGTALRSLLTNLTKPTDAMATAMGKLGISITDTSGQVKPLSQLLKELRGSFSTLSESEKASLAATIAGQQGMSGLLAIVNAAPEDFDNLTEAINGSSGAAEEMAAIMNDNLGGDIAELQSKFESLQINLFEKVEPALRVVVDVLGVLVDNFHFIATAIAGFISGPIGAFATLYTLCEDFKNFIDNAFASIADVFGMVGQAISDFFQGFIDWLFSIPETVGEFINSVGEFFSQLPYNIGYYLTDTILKIGEFVVNAVQKAIEFGSQFIQNVVTFLTQLPGKVWNFLTQTIQKVIAFAKDFVTKAIQAGKDFFDGIVNKVTEIPGKMLEIGKNIVEGIWNGISGAAGWLYNKVKEFCQGVVDRIKEFFGIHSPSVLFEDEIGVYLAQGIGVGFSEEMDDVTAEMTHDIELPTTASDNTASLLSPILRNLNDDEGASDDGFSEPLTVVQNNTINNQLDIQQVAEALMEEIRMA